MKSTVYLYIDDQKTIQQPSVLNLFRKKKKCLLRKVFCGIVTDTSVTSTRAEIEFSVGAKKKV